MCKLDVVEKFVSINGEGTKAGQLAVFIRFKGCNLACEYCDTQWANQADAPAQQMTARGNRRLCDIYRSEKCYADRRGTIAERWN